MAVHLAVVLAVRNRRVQGLLAAPEQRNIWMGRHTHSCAWE